MVGSTAGSLPLLTRILDDLLVREDGYEDRSPFLRMWLRIQFQAGVAILGPTVGPVWATLSFVC